MAITADETYTYIQDLFQRGVVMIVGSGASSAYGLPGMPALAAFLADRLPARLTDADQEAQDEWSRVQAALDQGSGLESAIGENPLPERLADLVTTAIAECVGQAEAEAVSRIILAEEVSSFGRLFAFILRSTPQADVITTNYDRLLEVHAARAGVRVDSMYAGHTIGRLDAKASREELYVAHRSAASRRPVEALRVRPHIRLAKPHGSLDWFEHDENHYRSDLLLPGARQVIAPGGNKYRLGYEVPFDHQRNRANRAINDAASIFTIGYGFNDEHLQTHLRARFAKIPGVVVSRSLTENAHEYLRSSPTSIGIEAADDGRHARILRGDDDMVLPVPLWDIDYLVKEVLNI